MDKNTFINPFAVTKATEYTDQQINDYWVEFGGTNLLNPNEYTPKYLIGGKGCGKTHLLRYHSYPNQKIRKSGIVANVLLEDKYIGIYTLLNGLDTSRFSGKGIDESIWQSVYQYYFELFVCDQLISTLDDIFYHISLDEKIKAKFVDDILNIFLEKPKCDFNVQTVKDLQNLMSTLRKSIDIEILNVAYTRCLNYEKIKTLFAPGQLIFGIPKLLLSISSYFKDVKIIYIFDEYEKLFEWQKIFINTVVWEKQLPTTIWVGSRRYGITTTETTTGEKLKPNSEYKSIELDNEFRENDTMYSDFAKRLCAARLRDYNNIDKGDVFLSAKLSKIDENIIISNLENSKKQLKHITVFKNIVDKLSAKSINAEDLIQLLSQDTRNALDEKYKLRHFYQQLANSKGDLNVLDVMKNINIEFKKFLDGSTNEFNNTVDKYKLDLLSQLLVENKVKNYSYIGYDNYIFISWGNPRVLLSILKEIFEKAELSNEKPLSSDGVISFNTQYLGLYKTSKWFYEDAEIVGEDGKNTYKSIWSLSDLMKLYRFSNRMTETNVSSFSFNVEQISDSARRCIKLAADHSFLIEIGAGRKQKNSGASQKTYQLNRILAPLWDLPISRRSVIEVSPELADSIFVKEYRNKFDSLYKALKQKYNFPFSEKRSPKKEVANHNQVTLFDTLTE